MKSPTLILGGLGLVVAVGWVAFGGWLSGAKPSQPVDHTGSTGVSGGRVVPPPLVPSASVATLAVAPEPVHSKPVRIQGGMETLVHGHTQWLYVSEGGRIMTDEDIAHESGGMVHARMERGVRKLWGPGVIWGGEEANQVSAVAESFPVPALAKKGTEERAPVGEVQPVPSGSPGTELLATPPGILATPPAMN